MFLFPIFGGGGVIKRSGRLKGNIRDKQLEPPAGHWKATGHYSGKFVWNILYKHLDLKGGVQGPGRGGSPLYPRLRSRSLYGGT